MRFAASLIRPLALFVLLTGLAVGGTARAQEVAESHLDAARKAITALRATAEFDNIILDLAQQLKAQLYQKNPDMQPLISTVVDEKALAIASRRADLEREAALTYARVFTEEQLNAIAEFYSSDAGQKLLSDGPIVTRELYKAAEIWQVGISRDLAVEVGKRLSEEDAKMQPSAPAEETTQEGPEESPAGE